MIHFDELKQQILNRSHHHHNVTYHPTREFVQYDYVDRSLNINESFRQFTVFLQDPIAKETFLNRGLLYAKLIRLLQSQGFKIAQRIGQVEVLAYKYQENRQIVLKVKLDHTFFGDPIIQIASNLPKLDKRDVSDKEYSEFHDGLEMTVFIDESEQRVCRTRRYLDITGPYTAKALDSKIFIDTLNHHESVILDQSVISDRS